MTQIASGAFTRIASVLLVLVSVFLSSACTTKSTTKIGNYEGSSKVLKAADPANAAARRVANAQAYLKSRNLPRAKFHLDKAREWKEDYPDLHYALGFYYQFAEQPEEAEKSFKRALRLDGKNPEYKMAYAQFLCQQERYASAEDYFDDVLADPTYTNITQGYYNLGSCKLVQDDQKAAAEQFRRALNVDAKFAPALLEMAEIEFDLKRYRRASAYLKRFRDTKSENARSVWLNLRTSYYLGDKDAVSSFALKLEQLYPDSIQTVEYLEQQSQWQ